MDDLPDYYAVLGVGHDAPPEEVRRAYRRGALRAHPDAGGTHAEMVRLSEAWAVLSDPERRAVFDRQRSAPGRSSADAHAWHDVAERVRAEAQQYPKDWGAFAAWFDSLAADVAGATYGRAETGWFSFHTVRGSWTGGAFVLAGVALAYWLAFRFFADEYSSWFADFPGRPRQIMMLGLLPFSLGCWVGSGLHRSVRDVLAACTPSRTAAASADAGDERPALVVRCPSCGQRLRVPMCGRVLKVRCRACGGRFEHRGEPPL